MVVIYLLQLTAFNDLCMSNSNRLGLAFVYCAEKYQGIYTEIVLETVEVSIALLLSCRMHRTRNDWYVWLLGMKRIAQLSMHLSRHALNQSKTNEPLINPKLMNNNKLFYELYSYLYEPYGMKIWNNLFKDQHKRLNCSWSNTFINWPSWLSRGWVWVLSPNYWKIVAWWVGGRWKISDDDNDVVV